MWLLDGLIELIAPTRCGGCELPGELFCSPCRDRAVHRFRHQCCPFCAAPHGALVCTECWRTEFAFSRAASAGELVGPLARAVVLHKDAGERRLGAVLGGLVADAVPVDWRGWADAVTWIPPTNAALKRRGFDHGASIAIAAASALAADITPLLTRRAARDQRVLARDQRTENARESFTAPGRVPPRVLLVDDVLTTGATLDSAARELLRAGAREVRVAVVARAW